MTYNQALLKSKSLTAKQSEKIYREVIDTYKKAYKEVAGQVSDIYARYGGNYNELIRYERLSKLLTNIDKELTRYNSTATKLLNKNSELNITDGFYRKQYIHQSFGAANNINLSFSALNPNLVEQAVYGTVESWKKIQTDAFKKKWGNPSGYQPKSGTLISELMKKHNTETITKIREALNANLIQGRPYADTAERLKNIIGRGKIVNGTAEADGLLYKAMRIAQTEGNRNWNAGTYATDKWYQRQQPDAKREWLATLDGDTRDRHAQLDGVEENEDGGWVIDGAFANYPGNFGVPELDINCRCTTVMQTKIPDNLRRARDPKTGRTEQFVMGNYDEWKKLNGLKTDQYGIVKS